MRSKTLPNVQSEGLLDFGLCAVRSIDASISVSDDVYELFYGSDTQPDHTLHQVSVVRMPVNAVSL